jgi:hypothetical protein
MKIYQNSNINYETEAKSGSDIFLDGSTSASTRKLPLSALLLPLPHHCFPASPTPLSSPLHPSHPSASSFPPPPISPLSLLVSVLMA